MELLKFLTAVDDIIPNEVISFLDAQTLRFMLQEPYHLHELVYFTNLKWGDFSEESCIYKATVSFLGVRSCDVAMNLLKYVNIVNIAYTTI